MYCCINCRSVVWWGVLLYLWCECQLTMMCCQNENKTYRKFSRNVPTSAQYNTICLGVRQRHAQSLMKHHKTRYKDFYSIIWIVCISININLCSAILEIPFVQCVFNCPADAIGKALYIW